MSTILRLLTFVLLLLGGSAALAQPYWESLLRRENLARPLPYERIECFSSHGEGLTNEDGGNYSRRDAYNWYIVCDIQGPGVLSEFGWSRRNPTSDMRFRIFVDDTVTWDINVRADSLCGRTSPFLPPLADSSAGWSWNYAPIPFQERLRITYIGSWTGYHGCAQIYDEGTVFESFRSPVPLSYFLKRDTMETVWSQPTRPALRNRPAVALEEDSTMLSYQTAELLSYAGMGAVRRLWMIPQDTTRSYLDRTVVRIYFDHNPEPAIAAQIGMLFGSPHAVTTYTSAITGRSGDTLYFQPPMPFTMDFRVEIENNVVTPNTNRIRIGADIVEMEADELPAYRLGARVLSDIPTQRYERFRAAEFSGRGNFLGIFLEVDNTSGSVLEGDEFLVVDGELVRAGIGTPEYFNGGANWLGPNGQPALARHFAHGVVTVTTNDFAAYRYHLSDAVPFYDSLSLDFDVGAWGHLTGNYRSLSLAYIEPRRFTVRDQDSSRSSTGDEELTIFGSGLANGRVLNRIVWNNAPLEFVWGNHVVTDSVLLIRVRAPFAATGEAALIAEFNDGFETIAPSWQHHATPIISFRVRREEIDGYAFAGDTLEIALRGYPEGESAHVIFEGLTLPWIGALPEAEENGIIFGNVTLPLDPFLMPEARAKLTARAISVEGFPDAVSDDYLTAIRLQRIEIERMTILETRGGIARELCACDYQDPDSLDPWGRMIVRRMIADTTGEFVRFALPIRANGNYRLNYFFGETFTAGLIRVMIDDSIDVDSVRVFDAGTPASQWQRSDTVRGNWHYLDANTHSLTFISDRALTIQDTFELILDQVLLESEFHLGIPVNANPRREMPSSASLAPPYPNPFNAASRLRFTLNTSADVKLEVFNLLGQLVQTLVNERMQAGEYVREFSCPSCASGLYLARLSLPNTTITQKMLLLK